MRNPDEGQYRGRKNWTSHCTHAYEVKDEKWEKCTKCYLYRMRQSWKQDHPLLIRGRVKGARGSDGAV